MPFLREGGRKGRRKEVKEEGREGGKRGRRNERKVEGRGGGRKSMRCDFDVAFRCGTLLYVLKIYVILN